jgi:hypothetical protein
MHAKSPRTACTYVICSKLMQNIFNLHLLHNMGDARIKITESRKQRNTGMNRTFLLHQKQEAPDQFTSQNEFQYCDSH